MKVDMAETLGRDQLIYGTVGGDGIVARIDSHLKVTRGDRMRLSIDVGLVHLFDVDTGQAFM